MENRKKIKVVAAVICDNMKQITKIFATARGYGEFEGQWEFPGGKIEEGESAEQAAKWLKKNELFSVQWLPADVTLIEKIEDRFIL